MPSWPSMPGTTTDGDLIAAASSTHPYQITLSLTSPKCRLSADPPSVASLTSMSGPRKAQVNHSGRVLEPHRAGETLSD
jgi:hypothetical protein